MKGKLNKTRSRRHSFIYNRDEKMKMKIKKSQTID